METDAAKRKATPVYSGFLKYFPLAIAEVARLSKEGNDQHNPGEELHWDRSKSGDELDALARHLLDNAVEPSIPHLRAVAWRAMAALEKACEAAKTSSKKPYLIIEDVSTGKSLEVYSVPGKVVENSKSKKSASADFWYPPCAAEISQYIERLNK